MGAGLETSRRDWVIEILRQPALCRSMSLREWDMLVRQGRKADMLARLAPVFEEDGHRAHIPVAPAMHFHSATRLVRAQQEEVERELAHIGRALVTVPGPIVLLKGAAYLAAALPPSRGRLYSDIDILLPKTQLADAEVALMMHGWATTHHSPYDQRYYRQWMHELPPLVHVRRQTALDVHHAIAPETARWRVDSALLLARAVPLLDRPGFAVLAPTDMVLHSMVHLLLNEELSHGLRDLSDLDMLLRHFAQARDFWDELLTRAAQLGVDRALHYGLLCTSAILATPVPEAVLAQAAHRGAPPRWLHVVMQGAWKRALRTPHGSAGDHWTPVALTALYLRAHWLRMPPLLLARHLGIKALGLNKDNPAAAR